MELYEIDPLPVMVMVDALPWVLAAIPLVRTSRVDEMADAQPQALNAVALLAPTRIVANTARTSYVMRAGNPAMSQQTVMFLLLPSLSRSINGTSQTT
jgi:hypothetical protein